MTSNSQNRTLAQAQRHILHPWDHMQDRANAERLVVARAEGVHLISADGRPTVKLSDNPNKAMGPEAEIERYKRVFGVGVQDRREVVV